MIYDGSLSLDEFKILLFIFTQTFNPDAHIYDPDADGDIDMEDMPPEQEGWTLDKNGGDSRAKPILRRLAHKGLIEDSGYRRIGEISGLYGIVWVVTDRAVERYGAQLRQSMN
jgi:hypothetical protein